ELLKRVRFARMQVDYMLILRNKEYLRESKNAGKSWPAEYAPNIRTRAFFTAGEAVGMPEMCETWDKVFLSLGERAGKWAEFREKCNPLLLDDITGARVEVLANAAAKACELLLLDQASTYIEQVKSCIKDGKMSIRELPVDVTCARMANHTPGRFADWDKIPQAVNLNRQGVNPSDCSGSFKLGWDSEYVYVLAIVQDDAFVPDRERYWMGDGIEIYFNMLDDEGLPPNTYGPDDFHFGVSADGFVYDYDSTSLGNPLGLGMVPGMITNHKRTQDGYLLEVAIPWKSMFLNQAEPGYTFGFSIAFDDLDTSGQYLKHHVLWKGSTAYINTQGWGRIELGD
ncbi:MAG: sugar-binding protein, partial [Armatimonadota bacterium]|nr:sugar-binding protein [Armatimonadota bacterium]